jgi:hypothetical protein
MLRPPSYLQIEIHCEQKPYFPERQILDCLHGTLEVSKTPIDKPCALTPVYESFC